MEKSLNSLPCFTQIDTITSIPSGMSQSCFTVIADNKHYFAKTINGNTEVAVAKHASKSGLSPAVIYHDKQWIINQYIEANNLAVSQINTEEKIKYTVNLMVKCHQLNSKPAALTASDVMTELICKEHYSIEQQALLLEIVELMVFPLKNIKGGVCCHGDLNFSNILITQSKKTWLVDFECACTAPLEYDLAMMIAVNNLTRDEIPKIIEQYVYQSSVNVDSQLLNHYLSFCYFMNALWYFNTTKETLCFEKSQKLLTHSKKQFNSLQSSLQSDDSSLLSGLRIKLTNILTTLDLHNQT